MRTARISARDVAEYLIWLAAEAGDGLTNLKLQKLLYYAQAWFIVLYGRKLFEEDFEAWVHGPVIRALYGCYKEFSYSPITPSGRKPRPLPEQVVKHLKNILQTFGGFSAYQLELMTHSELPWQNARRGLAPDQSSRNIISTTDMQSFYSGMLNGQKA